MNNLLFTTLLIWFPIGLYAQDDPPVASCLENFTADLGADGNIVLTPEDLNDGSSDTETPTIELLFSLDFGGAVLNCDDIGAPAQTVTLIVMDGDGLSSTCTTQVSVEDNLPPEATCQNVAVELGNSGSLSLSLGFARNVILTDFVDNCVASPPTISIAGGSSVFRCDQLGVTTRTFFYRDGNGQEDRCNDVRFQVTDPLGVCGEDPVANCQPFTVTNPIEPTLTLNANVFDNGSTDDRSVYTLVYSDATDRQENTIFDCSTTGFDQGQTFTAGQTGVIQSIKVRSGAATNTEIHLYNGNMATDPTVDPSSPNYSQNVELFFGEYFNRANLNVMTLDEPFPVVAGQEYTFILDTGSTLSRSCPGSADYAGGQPISGFGLQDDPGGQDFTFEVNIIGPTEMEFPTAGRTNLTVFAVDDQGNVSEGCATSVNPDQPLPVEWLSFGAHAGAKAVELQWETTYEPDNAGFHVERSAGGNDWSVIGEVAARAGANQRYDFTDAAPLEGTSYYRLRQTDSDGQVSYSPVETVEFFGDDRVIIFPNPATNLVNIQLPAGAELLELLDVSGRSVNARFSGREGELNAKVSRLPDGVYVLRTRLTDGRIIANRLVVH
ncbi:T9SS type A sorting domain-containing protein [Neolewinella persica]|uniref:T9SS type A sorting domain-containing protein n=1 Tax=Neolewinella persica TaxID=70998 RepID=UPI0003767153|nr:T9SS type A sorting domain-containing protein [Neolewinella persica]